jgi:hypothetical protein
MIDWSLPERSSRSVACYMRRVAVRRFGTAGGRTIERSRELVFSYLTKARGISTIRPVFTALVGP